MLSPSCTQRKKFLLAAPLTQKKQPSSDCSRLPCYANAMVMLMMMVMVMMVMRIVMMMVMMMQVMVEE